MLEDNNLSLKVTAARGAATPRQARIFVQTDKKATEKRNNGGIQTVAITIHCVTKAQTKTLHFAALQHYFGMAAMLDVFSWRQSDGPGWRPRLMKSALAGAYGPSNYMFDPIKIYNIDLPGANS